MQPSISATLLVPLTSSLPLALRSMLYVTIALSGALLIWLSAKLQVPFWPVPMTMQTFVVLALAMALGSKLGTATVAVYLSLGVLGLPVFAGTPERGMGIVYFVGPTGGYLCGFLVAAALCGLLAERGWDSTWLRTTAATIAGHAVILFLGWAWLAMLIGPGPAYAGGVAPFYASSLTKTMLVALALPFVRRRATQLAEKLGRSDRCHP